MSPESPIPSPWRLTRFPILASTNGLALEWMASGHVSAGDVLVAAEQTSGRGRHGRVWHSAPGALLMTAVLPFSPERAGWSALAAGIAVAKAVRELIGGGGPRVAVKWPNDVLLGGRKLAGVLCEASVPGLVAVGIGLNVRNPLPADPGLAGRTARLADTRPEVTVEAATGRVLAHLAAMWDCLLQPDIAPLRREWDAVDGTTGRHVRWAVGGLSGFSEGVDERGALLIRTDSGDGPGTLVPASAGEVLFDP